MLKPGNAFVLSGATWSDQNASHYARQHEPKADYVVITHLKASSDPYVVELRLVRSIDAKLLGNHTVSFAMARPEDGIPSLATRLLTLLVDEAEVDLRAFADAYQIPSHAQFPYYLLRLEQLLAVRCAAMDGTSPHFLSGEHDIIDGNIQLCVACPQSVTVRVLLAQTMLTMKRARRDIMPDFAAKIALLQKDHPLPQPAQGVVQRLFDDALRP